MIKITDCCDFGHTVSSRKSGDCEFLMTCAFYACKDGECGFILGGRYPRNQVRGRFVSVERIVHAAL